MSRNLVSFRRFTKAEFSIPLDALPSDRFQPVKVEDESFRFLGIRKNDLLSANPSLPPQQGQLSFLKSLHENLLGFYYKISSNEFKIEDVCPHACCPPDYFEEGEIILLAPVVRLYRAADSVRSDHVFKRFREEEIWKEVVTASHPATALRPGRAKQFPSAS